MAKKFHSSCVEGFLKLKRVHEPYYWTAKKPDLALADYKRAARIDPKNYDLYRKALGLAMAPDTVAARNARLLALVKTGKYAEALKETNQALKTNPRDARALIIRATALSRLGNKDRAQEDLKKAAEIDPGLAKGL